MMHLAVCIDTKAVLIGNDKGLARQARMAGVEAWSMSEAAGVWGVLDPFT